LLTESSLLQAHLDPSKPFRFQELLSDLLRPLSLEAYQVRGSDAKYSHPNRPLFGGSPDKADALRGLMAKYVGKCVDFVVEGVEDEVITRRLRQSIPVTALNTVTQLCTLLDAMLQEEKGITDPQVTAGGTRKGVRRKPD
jgi:hypothetical protein